MTREDWMAAHRALARHFAARPRLFPLRPSDRARLVATIRRACPGAALDARSQAEPILAGRYNLLGYRALSFGTPVDWHLDPVHVRRAPLTFWSAVPYLDPSVGDHKIVWELNRHQQWLALGRAWWLSDAKTEALRYRSRALDELESWLDANPPFTGINWAGMLELAHRAISWIWAIQFFADPQLEDDRPWLVDLLVALDAQLEHVRRNLSRYFSPNTHLTGEALGLYVAGRALPELRASHEWTRAGRAILLEEIDRQVLPDGGHVERSTHYHRYTLDFYLLALVMARLTSDVEAEGRFVEAVGRLASYARAVAGDNGRMPLIGDDDGGTLFPICGRDSADLTDTLNIAARVLDRPSLVIGPHRRESRVVGRESRVELETGNSRLETGVQETEEAWWLLGGWMDLQPMRFEAGSAGSADSACSASSAAAESAYSACSAVAERFDATGYYVARPAAGVHLVFDVGHHGYLNGGHAHADALSVTLALDGRPLLVDPGTAVYTTDSAIRDRFRTTAAHNTVVVDGRPQSAPAGPFHWRSRADARPLTWHVAPDLICFEGAHDGYAPVEHRRTVLFFDGLVVIADHVLYLAVGPHPDRLPLFFLLAGTPPPLARARRRGFAALPSGASRGLKVARFLRRADSSVRPSPDHDALSHEIAAYWHLHPDWIAEPPADGGICWRLGAGAGGADARAWMATIGADVRLHRADAESGLGWTSPRYGQIVPAATLVASTAGRSPISIVTVFGAGAPPLRIRALPMHGDSDWHRIGIAVDMDVFLFATERGRSVARADAPAPGFPPGAPPHPPAAIIAGPSGFGPTLSIETDARVAAVRLAADGSIRTAAQVGGTRLRAVEHDVAVASGFSRASRAFSRTED